MEFTIYDDDDVASFLEGLEERPQRKVPPTVQRASLKLGIMSMCSVKTLLFIYLVCEWGKETWICRCVNISDHDPEVSSVCVSGCSACRWTRRWTAVRWAHGALRRPWDVGGVAQTNLTLSRQNKQMWRGDVVAVTIHWVNCFEILSANIDLHGVAFVFTINPTINSLSFWIFAATLHFQNYLTHVSKENVQINHKASRSESRIQKTLSTSPSVFQSWNCISSTEQFL